MKGRQRETDDTNSLDAACFCALRNQWSANAATGDAGSVHSGSCPMTNRSGARCCKGAMSQRGQSYPPCTLGTGEMMHGKQNNMFPAEVRAREKTQPHAARCLGPTRGRRVVWQSGGWHQKRAVRKISTREPGDKHWASFETTSIKIPLE